MHHREKGWFILPIQVGPGRSRLIHHTPGDPHREIHPALHIQHHRLSHFNFLMIHQNLSIWRPLYIRGWFMALKDTLGIPIYNNFAIHDIYTFIVQIKVMSLFCLNNIFSLKTHHGNVHVYAFVSYCCDLDTSTTKDNTKLKRINVCPWPFV